MASSIDGTFDDEQSMHGYYCKICEKCVVKPQVLSCLHVLCEQCLMRLIDTTDSNMTENVFAVNCPHCEKKVTIGRPILKSYIASTLFYCSSCLIDTNSVARCRFCEKIFCLHCYKEHVFVICNAPNNGKITRCAVHNMDNKYYCIERGIVACVFCVTRKVHGDGLEFVSLTDLKNDVHNTIQTLLDTAKQQAGECYDSISYLMNVIANLRNKREIARNDATFMFQSFMKISDKYFYDTMTDMEAVYSNEESKVNKLLQEIETVRATVESYSEDAKEILIGASNASKLVNIPPLIPYHFPKFQPLNDYRLNAAVDNIFQNLVNDFYEKMTLNVNDLTASLDNESLDLRIRSSLKSLAEIDGFSKVTSLPLEIKQKLDGGHLKLNCPTGFCFNANEDIVVADKNNHRIQVYGKDGTFKLTFGLPGKMDGRLWYPSKVALLRNDNRYIVADQGVERWRLQVFSEDGIFMRKIPLYMLSGVAGMDVTSDDLIVLVDMPESFIVIINDVGDLIRRIDCNRHVRKASDVTVYGSKIYVCDYSAHRVAVFSTNGMFLQYIDNQGVFQYPSGIHVTENNIFVSDSSYARFSIARFAHNGLLQATYDCMDTKITHCCQLKINSKGDALTVAKFADCVLKMQFTTSELDNF